MNCEEARLRIGGEPSASSLALEEHLSLCAACSEFRREMTALDVDIRRALELSPVMLSAVRTPLRARDGMPRSKARVHDRRWARVSASRRWALAASVIATVAMGALLWGLHPAASLADDVIEHSGGEPASWSYTERLPQSTIDDTLRKAGVSLDAAASDVVYAMSCWFRGRYVPHLVVRTERGSFTVLVLENEQILARESFEDDGFTGMLQPARQGSIAVISRGPVATEALDEVARKVFTALHWTSAA